MEDYMHTGESPWNESAFVLELLSANEKMGAALAFLYEEYPEAKGKVEEFLREWEKL